MLIYSKLIMLSFLRKQESTESRFTATSGFPIRSGMTFNKKFVVCMRKFGSTEIPSCLSIKRTPVSDFGSADILELIQKIGLSIDTIFPQTFSIKIINVFSASVNTCDSIQ